MVNRKDYNPNSLVCTDALVAVGVGVVHVRHSLAGRLQPLSRANVAPLRFSRHCNQSCSAETQNTKIMSLRKCTLISPFGEGSSIEGGPVTLRPAPPILKTSIFLFKLSLLIELRLSRPTQTVD